MGLILIPLEIILRYMVFQWEKSLIQTLQKADFSDGLETFLWIITCSGTMLFIIFCATCIYLYSDPLLGFKTALVTFFGGFTITMLKIIYKIPRPYWIDSGIQGKLCDLDYSGPSDHAFWICFFYTYVTIIFFERYIEKPRHTLTIVLIGMIAFLWLLTSLILSYFGSTFLIESMIGGTFGFLYTLALLYFDTYIHELVEKAGFIVKESRRYKFYVFFTCLGLLAFAIVYLNCELVSWRIEQ